MGSRDREGKVDPSGLFDQNLIFYCRSLSGLEVLFFYFVLLLRVMVSAVSDYPLGTLGIVPRAYEDPNPSLGIRIVTSRSFRNWVMVSSTSSLVLSCKQIAIHNMFEKTRCQPDSLYNVNFQYQ